MSSTQQKNLGSRKITLELKISDMNGVLLSTKIHLGTSNGLNYVGVGSAYFAECQKSPFITEDLSLRTFLYGGLSLFTSKLGNLPECFNLKQNTSCKVSL